MRMFLSLAAVSALMFTGCTEGTEGGTPGSKSSFQIVGPATGGPTIKQNEKETVKLSLDRKSDFKKDVRLKVDAPAKIKAELNKDVIKASEETDFILTITAEQDAPIGDHVVKVTGTPAEGGAPSHYDLKVKVTAP
jgi:hypothetical protein